MDGGKLNEPSDDLPSAASLLPRFWAFLQQLGACSAQASSQNGAQNRPWMNTQLSLDQRADLVLKEMTLDEKIDLMHGQGMPGWKRPMPKTYLGNQGAGFILGIPRLGIPQVEMSDAAYGVRMSAQNGRYSTALPSNIAAAATWDPEGHVNTVR